MEEIIGSWPAVLPPLLAIVLALAFRQVVIALGVGVWVGTTLLINGNPVLGLFRSVEIYVVNALNNPDHVMIVIFSLLLGGMIGVIARSGSAQGLAKVATRFATTRRRGQLSAWTFGMCMFFDDYSNCLLVGSSIRPISDRLRISREKLAFIVDSVAAPAASVCFISAWIGVEIGYIDDQFSQLDLPADAYMIFLKTIPFCFYPILMLFFVLINSLTRRDFGPMLRAEHRAVKQGKLFSDNARPSSTFEAEELKPVSNKPQRYVNAVIPIVLVVLGVVFGMILDGRATILEKNSGSNITLAETFANANSFRALLWAALLGCITAMALVISQRVLTLRQTMDAWVAGIKSMVLAIIILVLAWSLGEVCRDIGTAEFIVGVIGERLPVGLLPALVFLLSALVGFATGSSWGCMGILYPLVIPLAFILAPFNDLIMLASIGSVLAGAVWGDNCSPISDTTVLSAMSSSCDHIDHVRTQLPYASVVGLISLLVGNLACGLGIWSPWMGLAIGASAIIGIVFVFGRPSP